MGKNKPNMTVIRQLYRGDDAVRKWEFPRLSSWGFFIRIINQKSMTSHVLGVYLKFV